MVTEKNRRNSQEGVAHSGDILNPNRNQDRLVEGVRLVKEVFLIMEKQERRSDWSTNPNDPRRNRNNN